MQIKFISVESTDKVTKSNKPYVELEVAYKNLSFEGKLETKKLNPFGNKDVFNTLKTAKNGDVFDIERTKNDAGFWDWISIKGGSEGVVASSGSVGTKAPTPTPKSTYETSEERAKKQVYIIRQSSVSAAISTLKTDKKNPSVPEVLDVAKQFEQYVLGLESAPPKLADLPPTDSDEDDIPY